MTEGFLSAPLAGSPTHRPHGCHRRVHDVTTKADRITTSSGAVRILFSPVKLLVPTATLVGRIEVALRGAHQAAFPTSQAATTGIDLPDGRKGTYHATPKLGAPGAAPAVDETKRLGRQSDSDWATAPDRSCYCWACQQSMEIRPGSTAFGKPGSRGASAVRNYGRNWRMPPHDVRAAAIFK